MRHFYTRIILILATLVTSCKIGTKSPHEPVTKKPEADTFSIRNIVKDFKGDASVKEIMGIQTDKNFLYVEYFVYKAKKNRVLKGVDKIIPKKVNDYISDTQCGQVSKEQFYGDIASNEKDELSYFFWKFETLKSVTIYTCIKAPLRHYIIFDNNSDTVYHRIEELRD